MCSDDDARQTRSFSSKAAIENKKRRTDRSMSARPVPVSGDVTPPKSKKLKKGSASRPTKQKKAKKNKIRTYCRRKAEIEELLGEIARLKEQKEKYTKRAEALNERQELLRREETNQALREVLHNQRLAFASSLSMVSQILVRCVFNNLSQ
ncbi:hypothetical protein PPTG_19978 [Phytophthora nicotianae INRA-310]|uniref:Uncharacterized protein n=1 Tax=Phytophthora nicotianae (strain INRA-310) TaxID=761204 RepID=W2PAL8_PHYN3|nr:hypothetical protein PPTG_19978 [Phytophthora nicotianae INRA-310]ETM97856.1 hypothetical protein PPTG_19978 [Phytophthora nicotianae INRA-310]